MRRTRQDFTAAGQGIKAQLASTELSLDRGLIAQANLMAVVLTARIELGLEACYQRDLVRQTGEALAHSLAGRERMLDIHQGFASIADTLRLEPRAFGDSGDKDKPVIVDPPVALCVVPEGEKRRAA